MAQLSKRYRQATSKVEQRAYPLDEAISILKSFPAAKFDQTVEIHLRLGIDPKQSEQAIRGSVSLPAGIGKTKKVIAFCADEMAEAAKAAGAIEAGGDELVKKVNDGWTDFDVAVSHPSMMPKVGRLGRVLGPQGKMPSPKSGTVNADVVQAVREFAAGKVEFRNDSTGNLHAVVGKVSFEPEKLKQNIEAFVELVRRMKPSSSKGVYIRNVVLAATMSPGVRVAL